MADSLVFRRSMQQASVASSTMEAEYFALAVVWMTLILDSIGCSNLVQGLSLVWCDRQAAIAHAGCFTTHEKPGDLLTKSLGKS